MAHHDEPGDEGCVPRVPETVVGDVCLHLQVEEEALVDDVGNPAGASEPRNTSVISVSPITIVTHFNCKLRDDFSHSCVL